MVKINKTFFAGGVVFLLVLAFVGYAFAAWSAPDAYHDATEVRVRIGSDYYSLQKAIDDGLITTSSGGGSDTYIQESFTGTFGCLSSDIALEYSTTSITCEDTTAGAASLCGVVICTTGSHDWATDGNSAESCGYNEWSCYESWESSTDSYSTICGCTPKTCTAKSYTLCQRV